MKKNKVYCFLLSLLCGFFSISMFQSCIDDEVGDNFYTFVGETIYSYLENDTAGNYTELLRAVEKADLGGLLSSYGTYTFFAPTNEAFEEYYQKNGTTLEEMDVEDLKYMIYYHLIEQAYLTDDFGEGLLPTTNMKNRYLNVSLSRYQEGEKLILVNQSTPILLPDQEVHNGVIHIVGGVLEPSDMYLAEKIEETGYYTIFHRALIETGLADSLLLVEDETYEMTQVNGYNGLWNTPETRKYGYTAFVESDQTYALEGIYTYEDLVRTCQQKYIELYGRAEPTADVTDRYNSLNMFVAYHLLEQMCDVSSLVDTYYKTRHTTDFGEVNHTEYIPTMRHRSYIEVKTGNYINMRSDGTYVGLVEDLDKINVDCLNGIYHEINKILWYDNTVEDDVLNKRLRVDFSSVMPELTNNGLRGEAYSKIGDRAVQDGYFKYCSLGSDPSALMYVKCGNNDWCYYQGDGITGDGWYDLSIELPPLPPGTWEIRVGTILYTGSGNLTHGVAQLYFDGEPIGIPLDFGMDVTDPVVGWVLDSNTEDNGAANDRAMRNRGWMKGPTVYGFPSGEKTARDHNQPARRILTTITVNEEYDENGVYGRDKPHIFRAKGLETALFDLDYFEFVPKWVVDDEDVRE